MSRAIEIAEEAVGTILAAGLRGSRLVWSVDRAAATAGRRHGPWHRPTTVSRPRPATAPLFRRLHVRSLHMCGHVLFDITGQLPTNVVRLSSPKCP